MYTTTTVLFLMDCLLFFNFLVALKEGERAWITRQYKYIMLYFKADGPHSITYALQCLYQFFLVNALLSPRDRKQFVWNRSVNNNDKKGTNIPLDEDTEHSNNSIEQGIKNHPMLLRRLFRDYPMQKVQQHQYKEILMTVSRGCHNQERILLEDWRRICMSLSKGK